MTKEQLKSLVVYQDGALYWRPGVKYHRPYTKLGSVRKDGYSLVRINGIRYYIHRLIFLYHNGYFPPVVDHKDQDPRNNTIANLRAATRRQNQQNRRLRPNMTSKFKGVCKPAGKDQWLATIIVEGKQLRLGWFDTETEGAKAYNTAAKKHFGDFASLNDLGGSREQD